MNRTQLMAAEIHGLSYDHYAGHQGVKNVRFDILMPRAARNLERADREQWSDQHLAEALDIELAAVPEWRRRYRDAVEVVDARNAAESFRCSVRHVLQRGLKNHMIDEPEIESLVNQICVRAADLSYLLRREKKELADYSVDLRHPAGSGG